MKYLSVAALAVTLLLCVSCRKGNVSTPIVDARVAAIWSNNEKVFEKALDDSQEGEDFDQACGFFQGLTGIELHVNYSTVGILPTEETPQDLVRIRGWYKINKNRLYWDDKTMSLKVRPKS